MRESGVPNCWGSPRRATVSPYAWFAGGSNRRSSPSILITVNNEFGTPWLGTAAIVLRHSLSKSTTHIHHVDRAGRRRTSSEGRSRRLTTCFTERGKVYDAFERP